MSRMVLLVIVIVALVAVLFFISTLAKEQPTHSIEVSVPQGGNAR
jgi:hypothetical protein